MLTSVQILSSLYHQQQVTTAQLEYYRQAAAQREQQQSVLYMPPPAHTPPVLPPLMYTPATIPGIVGAGIYRPVLPPNLGAAVAGTMGANPALQSLGYMYPLAMEQQLAPAAATRAANLYGSVGRFAAAALPFALMQVGIDPFTMSMKTFGHGLATAGGFGSEFLATEGFLSRGKLALQGIGRLGYNLIARPWEGITGLAKSLPLLGAGLVSFGLSSALFESGHWLMERPLEAVQAAISTHQTINRNMGDLILGGRTATGRGITLKEASEISRELAPLGYRFFTTPEDTYKGMEVAVQTGMARAGVTSAEDLKKKLVKISKQAYTIAEGLTSTVETATKILERWKEIGVDAYTLEGVKHLVWQLRGFSSTAGVNTVQMQRMMSTGAELGMSLGIERGAGAMSMGRLGAYSGASLSLGVVPEKLFREITGGSLDVGAFAQQMFAHYGTFTRGNLGLTLAAAMASGKGLPELASGGITGVVSAAQGVLSKKGAAYILSHQHELRSRLMEALTKDPGAAYNMIKHILMDVFRRSPTDDEMVAVLTRIFGWDEERAWAFIDMGKNAMRIRLRQSYTRTLDWVKYQEGYYRTRETIWGRLTSFSKEFTKSIQEGFGEPVGELFIKAGSAVKSFFRGINEATLPTTVKDFLAGSEAATQLIRANLPIELAGRSLTHAALPAHIYKEDFGLGTAAKTIAGLQAVAGAGFMSKNPIGMVIGGAAELLTIFGTKMLADVKDSLGEYPIEYVESSPLNKAVFGEASEALLGKQSSRKTDKLYQLTPNEEKFLKSLIRRLLPNYQKVCRGDNQCAARHILYAIEGLKKRHSEAIYQKLAHLSPSIIAWYIANTTGVGYKEAVFSIAQSSWGKLARISGKTADEIADVVEEGIAQNLKGNDLVNYVTNRLGVGSDQKARQLVLQGLTAQTKEQATELYQAAGLSSTLAGKLVSPTSKLTFGETKQVISMMQAYGPKELSSYADELAVLSSGRAPEDVIESALQHLPQQLRSLFKDAKSPEDIAKKARTVLLQSIKHSEELQKDVAERKTHQLIKTVGDITRRLEVVAAAISHK